MSGIQSTSSNTRVQSSSPTRSKAPAPKATSEQAAEPKDKVSLSAPEETYPRHSAREILRALRHEPAPEPSKADKLKNLQDYSRKMLEDYTRGH